MFDYCNPRCSCAPRVKECRELEGRYSANFTPRVSTTEPNECKSLVKELEKSISQKDFALQVKKASKHHQHLCNIAVSVGWEKLWDHSLDHGITCVTSLKNLVRIFIYPNHAARKCPLCENDDNLQFDALVEHIMAYHTSSGDFWDILLNSLIELDPSCFRHLLCLYKLF